MNLNLATIMAVSYFISRLTTSSVLISEFEPNPPSTDPSTQTIEFYSNSLSNFDGCFISIESDNSNTGIIDRASDFSCTFDNNGLCTISINDLENPSFTVALYDTNDLDCSTIDTGTTTINDITATPLDALGSPDASSDEQYLYGATLGGQDFKYTGEEPAIVFRDGSNGEWFAVHSDDDTIYDIDANLIDESLFNRNATVTTFGKINPQLINEMSTTTISSSDISTSTSTSAPIPTLTGVTSAVSSADTTLESTIPDTTALAPRSTLPDTTLPDTTVPDTTVPDTTVLATAPGSTAPGSTVHVTGTTPPGTTEASEMEPTSMSSSSVSSVSSSMTPNQMKTTLQQSVTSVTSTTSTTSMAPMASITSTESMNGKLITSTASTTPYMTSMTSMASMTSTQSMEPPSDSILSSMTSTKPIISMDTTEDKTEIMMTEDISTTELDTKTNNAPSKHYGLLINQFITFIFVYSLFCVY